MEISTLGIDLSKTTFHVIGLNARGEIVLRKELSRKQLLVFTANRQQILIGTEACGGAHYLARALREQGHDVRLHSRRPILSSSLFACKNGGGPYIPSRRSLPLVLAHRRIG